MRQAAKFNHFKFDPLNLYPAATNALKIQRVNTDLSKMMLPNRTTASCSGRRAAAGSSSAFKAPRLLRAAAVSPKQQQCAEVNPALSLALASALVSTPLAAWADETNAAAPAAAEGVQQAAAAVTEAAAEAAPAPQWLSYIIVLTPIILYGLFNVYRNQANPRASFSDFLFLVAGVAVIANLVSIIGFKVRLF